MVGETQIVVGGEEKDTPSAEFHLGGRAGRQRAQRAAEAEGVEAGQLGFEFAIERLHRAVMPAARSLVNLDRVNG
jgi:hypothetical protein